MTSPATPGDTARPPLTILLAADTFAPHVNGAARFAERLAAGLAERGHDVHAMVPSAKRWKNGQFIEEIEGQRITVHRLPAWRYYPHDWLTFVIPWMTKFHARRVLSKVNPDVVHIQSHVVIGRGVTRIAHKRGIPVVATNHIMAENVLDFTTLPPVLDKVVVKLAWADAMRTFSMARAVTTPTRRAADFLEATIPLTGVIPISCGIDRTRYRPVVGPRASHRILSVGRLTSEKNLDVTLQAVARMDPALDVHFDIVGGGDQRRALERLTEELGLSGRVSFHGLVDDDQLRELYSRASVFAISSIAELQSIATMEAMASALPVVAANAVALPHLVHDGENGYLVEPGNADELAARLTDVLTADAAEYERMQRASLDGVQIHDITRTLDTFEALYRDEPLPE